MFDSLGSPPGPPEAAAAAAATDAATDAARFDNWAVDGEPAEGIAIEASGLPKNGYDMAIDESEDSDELLSRGDVIEPEERREVGSVVLAVVVAPLLRLLLPPPPLLFLWLLLLSVVVGVVNSLRSLTAAGIPPPR